MAKRKNGSVSPDALPEPPTLYKGPLFELAHGMITAAEARKAERDGCAFSNHVAKSLRNRHLDALEARECDSLEDQKNEVHPAERAFMKLWNNFMWDREQPPHNRPPIRSRSMLPGVCMEFIEDCKTDLRNPVLRQIFLIWLLRIARYSSGRFGKKQFLDCLQKLPTDADGDSDQSPP